MQKEQNNKTDSQWVKAAIIPTWYIQAFETKQKFVLLFLIKNICAQERGLDPRFPIHSFLTR